MRQPEEIEVREGEFRYPWFKTCKYPVQEWLIVKNKGPVVGVMRNIHLTLLFKQL
jgi:hypothetical protein